MFNSLTFEQIKEILTEEAYEAFNEWMIGQTCKTNEAGQMIVYAWDFDRWVRDSVKRGSPAKSQGPDWD